MAKNKNDYNVAEDLFTKNLEEEKPPEAKKKMGRPKSTSGIPEGEKFALTTYITKKQNKKLSMYAIEHEMEKSEVIRMLIESLE